MESVNGGSSHGNGHAHIGAQLGASVVPLSVSAPAAIAPTSEPIGEIVDTSVAELTAQACVLNVAPPFGGFVKVMMPERTVYGVVYAIHTGSLEPGGRPVLRGRDGMRDGAIFEQNPDLEQLLRTEFSALVIGFEERGETGQALRAYLPASPPPLHWSVVECDRDEIARLTTRLDYFRTILSATSAPVDALLAANIRLAGAAWSNASAFRLKAGRELATLLQHDHPRLTAILRALGD
jgi:hypothetical protein